MARVYSTCLYRASAQTGLVVIDFSPITDTVIIRDVVCFTLASGTAEVLLYDNLNSYIIVETLSPPGDYLHWQGRQVLDPGSSLNVYVSGAATSVRISGYLLGA